MADPRLAWHDVNAPDFSVALQALQAAGNRFDAGVGAARSGVAGVNNVLDERAAQAYAAAAAKYTDPVALQAAIAADPRLGIDTNRLSAATLGGGAEKVSTLLGLQSSLGNAAQVQRDRGFANAEDDLVRAAGPEISKYEQLRMTNPTAAQELLSSSTVLQGLPPERLKSVITGGMGLRTAELGQLTGQRSYDRQGVMIGREDVDYKNGLDVETLVNSAQGKADSPEEVIAYYNDPANRPEGMTDTAWNTARTKTIGLVQQYGSLSGIPPGATSAGSGGGLGGTAGGGNAYDAVLGNGAYGPAPSKPISQMSIGEAINYGDSVLKPGSKAKGIGVLNGKVVGSSAVGAYQIVGSTMRDVAPAVFGKDWQNTPMTAENQDKLGQYIFEHNKSASGLQGQWASLTPTTAAQAAGLPWDQAKHIIAEGESGALRGSPSAADLQGRQTASTVTQAVNEGNDPLLPVAQRFVAAQADKNLSGGEVAAKMTAVGQLFAGEDPGALESVINRAARHFGVAPSVAGAMVLSARTGPKSSLMAGITGKGATLFGSGLNAKIDASLLRTYAEFAHDPQAMVNQIVAKQGTDAAVATSGAAIQELITLGNAFKAKALLRQNRNMPAAVPSVRLSQLLASASAAEIKLAGMEGLVADGTVGARARDVKASRTVPVDQRVPRQPQSITLRLPPARPVDASRPRIDWNHPSLLRVR